MLVRGEAGVGKSRLLAEVRARTLVDLHLRRITYPQAVRVGRLRIVGSPALQRRFVHWFRTSPFADYAPGPPVASETGQQTDA